MDAIDLGLYAGLDKPTMQFQANQAFISPSRGRGGGGNSRRDSSSGQSEGEEPEDVYVANDVIYEQSSSGQWSVPRDMVPSDSHGYLINYEDIKNRSQKQIIDKHLAGSDPRQYEFYIWTSSDGKNRVQIRRKQSYTKPGPATPAARNNPSDNYLNE